MSLTTDQIEIIIQNIINLNKYEDDLNNFLNQSPVINPTLDINNIQKQINDWRILHPLSMRSEYVAIIKPLKEQLLLKIEQNKKILIDNDIIITKSINADNILRASILKNIAKCKTAIIQMFK